MRTSLRIIVFFSTQIPDAYIISISFIEIKQYFE